MGCNREISAKLLEHCCDLILAYLVAGYTVMRGMLNENLKVMVSIFRVVYVLVVVGDISKELALPVTAIGGVSWYRIGTSVDT